MPLNRVSRAARGEQFSLPPKLAKCLPAGGFAQLCLTTKE
jgi:hypothetical protein